MKIPKKAIKRYLQRYSVLTFIGCLSLVVALTFTETLLWGSVMLIVLSAGGMSLHLMAVRSSVEEVVQTVIKRLNKKIDENP